MKINNIYTADEHRFKEDFNSFKSFMINESMKYFFFNEVNSFKNQLLETSEIVPIRLQSETDNINTSGISERLSFQDKFSTLKNQSDRKDKVINPLLEKLEKKTS